MSSSRLLVLLRFTAFILLFLTIVLNVMDTSLGWTSLSWRILRYSVGGGFLLSLLAYVLLTVRKRSRP